MQGIELVMKVKEKHFNLFVYVVEKAEKAAVNSPEKFECKFEPERKRNSLILPRNEASQNYIQ